MLLFDDSYLIMGKSLVIDNNITVNNPTVESILEYGEEKYYSLILKYIAVPSDYKVQLFDIGIDFEKVSEFEFFLTMVKKISFGDTGILFGEMDFRKFDLCINAETEEKFLKCGDIIIDELVCRIITGFIRKIHGIPTKNPEKFANEHVKKYILEIERDKLKYVKEKKEAFQSVLLPMVSGLVNCAESSYNYDTAVKLTVSQLHDAIRRIQKIKHHTDVMRGIYAGTIKPDLLNKDDLNWIS